MLLRLYVKSLFKYIVVNGTRMMRIHFVKTRMDADFFLLVWLSLIERSQWLTDDADSLRENADGRGFFLVGVVIFD
jgi:hypothetical protein